jgi:cytoskeletal protein CcmA (bactofilin family)
MSSANRPEAPSRLPAGLTLTGELTSRADLLIDGTVDGQITVPEQQVTINHGAKVKARVLARVVTIAGRFEGSVTATERVEIEHTAHVNGHVQSPSVVLMDGAKFQGSMDPNRSEAAMLVARYRQKQG